MELLKSILMIKFNLDNDEVDKLVEKSKREGNLDEWYGIAQIKLEQEYERNKAVQYV